MGLFKSGFIVPPALKALLIQFVTLVLVFLLAQSLFFFFQLSFSGWWLVICQAVIATGIAYWIRMAFWWRIIHFLFPILIVCVLTLQLPPWVYLIGFVVSASLFWSTFRTQVPYYPSNLRVWQEVEKLLPVAQSARVVDIGSGMGGFTLYLANKIPSGEFLGIEIAPLPWLISCVRAYIGRSSARFIMQDYERLNFADYDLVFAYLSPAAMPNLWKKADREMRKNSLLVSYEFDIPQVSPSFTIDLGEGSPSIYVWRL